MRSLLLLVVLAGFGASATAQLRTIPKDAKLGEIRHVEAMVVEIDGKPHELAPGAQIRDPDNRLVVPASLAEKAQMRYLVDRAGQVSRVWILSPREMAELPPAPYPK